MLKKIYIYVIIIIAIILNMFLYPENNKRKEKKKLKRAIAECASLMAVSQTNYWLKYSNWIEDWQYELSWADQKKRIFGLDGQKFDSNCFQTNWTHGLSGAMYYNFARTNGLNLLESSVFTTLTSFYWEFIVEWREVISINDNIFTSFGGISIGESFYQLGSYFNGKKGLINNIAGILTNPVMAINRWFDRNKNYSYFNPEKNEMSFFVGTYFLMNDTKEQSKDRNHFFGFNSSLTYLPDVDKKGITEKTIKGTIHSNINIKVEIKDKAIEEIIGQTRNVYFGKFNRIIKEYDSGYIKGHSYLYSLFSGFYFYKKRAIAENDSCMQYKYIDDSGLVETPTEFTDKLAVINMTGPYSEFNYYFGKAKISLINSLSLDFGLINAFALNKYSETEDISYTKATLFNYGYYYAFGYTFDSKFSFFYKRLNLNAGYKYQSYNSIEGFDRYEDKIINEFNIHDTKSTFSLDIGYKFNILPIGLKLILEDRYRKGTIKDITKLHKETKVYIRLDLYI